jgi:hypothetical protein
MAAPPRGLHLRRVEFRVGLATQPFGRDPVQRSNALENDPFCWNDSRHLTNYRPGLHNVKQRCCRWLLQTQDRVGSREFLLKQECLAIMLGVHRPTVTLGMGTLQDGGLITSRYGRVRVLERRQLENAPRECYEVIHTHFQRLGL